MFLKHFFEVLSGLVGGWVFGESQIGALDVKTDACPDPFENSLSNQELEPKVSLAFVKKHPYALPRFLVASSL